jgi:hypothetical protein
MEIIIEDKKFEVSVQDDHTYLVQSKDMNEFILCPKLTEQAVVWTIEKGMAPVELIEKIGVAIEKFEE